YRHRRIVFPERNGRSMLVYVGDAWRWAAAGAGATTVLFAGYLALRGCPPVWEAFLVLTALAASATAVTTWLAHRKGQEVVAELTQVLASLRENSSLGRLRKLAPDLNPLTDQIEALGQAYRQVLADLVARTQALQDLRRDASLPEITPPAVPGR